MSKENLKINLPSYDSIFTTQKERDDEKAEKIPEDHRHSSFDRHGTDAYRMRRGKDRECTCLPEDRHQCDGRGKL